jgi:RNA-directed DNA polymerase
MNSTDAERQKGDEHHGDEGAGGTRSPEHGSQQAFAAFEQTGGNKLGPSYPDKSGFSSALMVKALTANLMEQVCDPKNLRRAYRRVRSNKGKPGVDGMTVHELHDWLRENNEALVASLLDGTYLSQPVRGVQIEKSGGGKRQLGIPVVVDRMVQQAILQVLDPIFDPTFSNSSFGFRSGRSLESPLGVRAPHMALEQGRKYVAQEGRGFVVDLDLEKFFDKVNHDILMSRIARRIGDKRLLRIIRRFLRAGLMQDGVCVVRDEGTPDRGRRSMAGLIRISRASLLRSWSGRTALPFIGQSPA